MRATGPQAGRPTDAPARSASPQEPNEAAALKGDHGREHQEEDQFEAGRVLRFVVLDGNGTSSRGRNGHADISLSRSLARRGGHWEIPFHELLFSRPEHSIGWKRPALGWRPPDQRGRQRGRAQKRSVAGRSADRTRGGPAPSP